MSQDLSQQIEVEKAQRIAALEREYAERIQLARARQEGLAELTQLASRHGFADVTAFLSAVGVLAPAPRPRGRAAARASETAAARKPRTRLDEAQRAAAVEALRSGRTAGEVAAEFGVSAGTINTLKKQAGLTKPRA